MTRNDLNAMLRRALEPNFRKVMCALGGTKTYNATPTLTSTSTSGNTTEGIYKVSITNTGGSSGTVAGAAFEAGTSITFEGYLDPYAGGFTRIGAIPYDATGTTFLIAETP